MNHSLVNRVEAELNQWRSREERFSKLFSFSLSNNRALLKEKLDYYDRGHTLNGDAAFYFTLGVAGRF